MAKISPAQATQLWIANGGSSDPTVIKQAMSIICAESGFDTDPAGGGGAFGLTQIQGDPAAKDPTVAIRRMIEMSSNGTNWAPWCTAWANPGANCGHGNPGGIQPGSAAARCDPSAVGAGATGTLTASSTNPFSVLDSFNKFFGALLNPTTWRNLGELLAGAILVGVGFLITRDALRGSGPGSTPGTLADVPRTVLSKQGLQQAGGIAADFEMA